MCGDLPKAEFHVFAALSVLMMEPEKKGILLFYIWENQGQVPGENQVMERPRAPARVVQ